MPTELPVPGDICRWNRERDLMVGIIEHRTAEQNCGPSWILRDELVTRSDWAGRPALVHDPRGLHCSTMRKIARAE